MSNSEMPFDENNELEAIIRKAQKGREDSKKETIVKLRFSKRKISH